MLSDIAARVVGTSYRRHEGSAYPVIASEAKQSIVTERTESMDCFRLRSSSYGGQVVAGAPRNDGCGFRI